MNARLQQEFTAVIDDLSHDGRGVARIDGKAVFVTGALPGETVTFLRRKRHRHFDEAETLTVAQPAAERIEPRCAHFGVCGGCSMQHLEPAAQIRAKQKVLADNFSRLGKIAPDAWLEPLTANVWGYRRRARLGVKHVRKKGRVLVGFRERHAPCLAELASCHVLDAKFGTLLPQLGELVAALSIPDRIPQFEIAVADNAAALVVRHLDPLTADDRERLARFGAEHDIRFYLQAGGSDSIVPLKEGGETLYYDIAVHGIRVQFEPADFIQVNRAINDAMIDRALALLDIAGSETVLDLFCGLGNFTLPMARHAAQVAGVEGDAGLVQRARKNAARNGIANTEFFVADLFAPVADFAWRKRYDKVLLDPPRAGAEDICRQMQRFAPERIVYVSCHPGTLARDAGILVHEQGYRLAQAGVMDMFPHTAHVESIALFVR